MKRLVSLLLGLLMVFMVSTAMAETVTVAPGDQLVIDVQLSSAGGEGVLIGIKTNDAPVSFVSAVGGDVNDTVPPKNFNDFFAVVNIEGVTLSADGTGLSGKLTDYTLSPLVTGKVGTLTIEVGTDAEEGVAYTVETYVAEGSNTVEGSVTFMVEKPADRMPGDVDVDGDVDLIDVMLTSTYVYVEENDINLLNADMDEDGEITLMDIMAIARIVYPT